MVGNILSLMVRLHIRGETAYETKVIEDKLYVNSAPNNIGRRVTQPHKEYSDLQNLVREYLNHMEKDSKLLQVGREAEKHKNIGNINY